MKPVCFDADGKHNRSYVLKRDLLETLDNPDSKKKYSTDAYILQGFLETVEFQI